MTRIKEISDELLKSVSGEDAMEPMEFLTTQLHFDSEMISDLAAVINRSAKESATQTDIIINMRRNLAKSMALGGELPRYPADEVANSLMDAAGIGSTRGYIEGFMAAMKLMEDKTLTDTPE